MSAPNRARCGWGSTRTTSTTLEPSVCPGSGTVSAGGRSRPVSTWSAATSKACRSRARTSPYKADVARDRATRPEAKPQRLFVAVEVSEQAKRAVADAIEPWRQAFPQGRWVHAENWHVTMKFLGRTWPRLVGWV